MIAATRKLNAATDEFPSNDHFWYRAQPAGPYIDSQCDNRAFGHGDGQVMLSEDNGRTWPHRIAFPKEKHITFSHILKNGNVLFSTREKLFLSTDKLKTIQPITVKDANGADYLPHTPRESPTTPAGISTRSRASSRGT